VALSPVKMTLSHPDANPLGWGQFSHMANHSDIPVYALGGMVPSDLSDAWKSGAAGVSLMRSAWN
jgi:8-oxo-dGTP diphosphatase